MIKDAIMRIEHMSEKEKMELAEAVYNLKVAVDNRTDAIKDAIDAGNKAVATLEALHDYYDDIDKIKDEEDFADRIEDYNLSYLDSLMEK